jgi:peptidoglycan/xylan/chitin deacetylase (PgdA/CDA1 family)
VFKRLLKVVISAIFYIARKCVCSVAWLFGKHIPSPLVVLTYHAVKAEKLESFKRHMDYILRAGNPVWADSSGPETDDHRKIAVTFDDGFTSVMDNAFPVLQERGIPATIFVPAGYIGKKPCWVCDSKGLDVEDVILNETQLRGLADNIVKVGSHSITHKRLSQLDPKEAHEELVESKKILENILGKSVELFAFPYGDYNEETIELCAKAGYRNVFLAIPVWSSSVQNGIVRGRIDVSLDDWHLEYRLKILGAYQWLPLAIKLKRRLMSTIGGIG